MALQTWMPWLITCTYLYVQFAMGNKNRNGFLIAAATAVLSAYYNIATEQYGFLASNAVGLIISLRNYRKWRSQEGSDHACCHGECVAGWDTRPVNRGGADRSG